MGGGGQELDDSIRLRSGHADVPIPTWLDCKMFFFSGQRACWVVLSYSGVLVTTLLSCPAGLVVPTREPGTTFLSHVLYPDNIFKFFLVTPFPCTCSFPGGHIYPYYVRHLDLMFASHPSKCWNPHCFLLKPKPLIN